MPRPFTEPARDTLLVRIACGAYFRGAPWSEETLAEELAQSADERGDGLLTFLLSELGEESLTRREAMQRVDTAMDELRWVMAALIHSSEELKHLEQE